MAFFRSFTLKIKEINMNVRKDSEYIPLVTNDTSNMREEGRESHEGHDENHERNEHADHAQVVLGDVNCIDTCCLISATNSISNLNHSDCSGEAAGIVCAGIVIGSVVFSGPLFAYCIGKEIVSSFKESIIFGGVQTAIAIGSGAGGWFASDMLASIIAEAGAPYVPPEVTMPIVQTWSALAVSSLTTAVSGVIKRQAPNLCFANNPFAMFNKNININSRPEIDNRCENRIEMPFMP
jgi:hypothetical protein